MQDTLTQYKGVVDRCEDIYVKKAKDYGTSWRVLRPISIVDQLYIKAWRIRQIQEKGIQKIDDTIALIQSGMDENAPVDLSPADAKKCYDLRIKEVEELMLEKNHDYGEAWRDMSQQSFVDLILVKLLRIKQILANDGKTIVSEGINANFADIINYGIFALIMIKESETNAQRVVK